MTASFAVLNAAAALASGGIVAHALEGVWGLACDPFNLAAVRRLLRLKRRPPSKGLIVIAATPEAFTAELDGLPPAMRTAVLDSWPGAETWILPSRRFPALVTGGGPKAGVAARVPGHEQARRLAAAFGGPIVSTSANMRGRPPAVTELQVRSALRRKVDCVLSGAIAGRRGPSRIRDVRSGAVLR